MTRDEIIEGLKRGKKLICDKKTDPLLPWLLGHPNIENSEAVQLNDQESHIKFWWRN